MSDDYRVQLDVFSGPLDLLLYLIRRDEVDIHDIPIARIAEQYLQYVSVLEQLDPNAAGEFLVLAATLVELKSRALLPSPPIEIESDDDDPRSGLVKQLLEYKRYKDAAEQLGSARDERARRYVRKPGKLPADLAGVELEEVELWDLVRAFRGVMEQIGKGPRTHDVVLDESPLAAYAERIVEAIERSGPVAFHSLFVDSTTRAEMIGMFLALLELIRGQRVRAEQAAGGGEIYLVALEAVESAPLSDEERAALAEADAGYSQPSGRTEATAGGAADHDAGENDAEEYDAENDDADEDDEAP